MIESFGNALAEDLFDDKRTKATRAFSPELRRAAWQKLLYLHDAAELRDVRVPTGDGMEGVKGNWKGFHSIRVNDQWKVVFQWKNGNAFDVQVFDYH